MIWNGNVKLKTHKATAKSCDHWAFEKMTSLLLNAFQGKQCLYRESWILIKAKKWSECPVTSFPEFTVENLGREENLIQKSGTEKYEDERMERISN